MYIFKATNSTSLSLIYALGRKGLISHPSSSFPPPQSFIRDYLVHFEPLVVETLKIFSSTSSIVLQERCLFLMVQLLHLKVTFSHSLLGLYPPVSMVLGWGGVTLYSTGVG